MLAGKYNLILSNDILTEYREIFEREMGVFISSHVSEALLKFPSVSLISPSYFWNLMTNDPDDNKYVDAAIAGNADFIVTNDLHFKVLSMIDYPKIEVLSGEEFLSLLEKMQ